MKIDRRFEALACAALLLAALLACGGKGKNDDGSNTSPTPGAVKPRLAAVSANVTAVELAKDYHANEVAADQKYKDKVLSVTGRVQSIDKDAFDNMVLHLAGDNEFMGVMATMNSDQVSKVAQLSKGQAVNLTCTGSGMIIGSPTLKDCEVTLTDKDLPANKPAPAQAPKKK